MEYALQYTSQQMRIINEYCDNYSLKLKKLCNPIIARKNIPQYEHDELYDDAMKVLLESVKTYDNTKSSFQTYLIGNIKRSFYDWTRDRQRGKRCNLLRDSFGNLVKDEVGKAIPIPDISFDTPTEDNIDLSERLASDFVVENESSIDFQGDDKVKEFLDTLSNKQKKVLLMRMDDIPIERIKEKLNITDNEYSKIMKSIKMNENLSMFINTKRDFNYREENKMERIMEINEADNYRMDKYTMFSLLQDKKNGDINCKYILQRKPFQWTDEERNRYICRLLSNLPIPEIILCEQNIKGMTIAHLIDGLQRLSYAEAYRENRFKIGAKGSERHLIQYRDFVVDENGNRVTDEDGLPIFEIKVCDVVGKFYKDLPEELKKRFNNFNVNVTKFFNCTDEQIADHIRDYNNHASMNKEQGGMTKITTKTASRIKEISEKNSFFKNCGSYSSTSHIKGKIDRIVAESIMLMFHCTSWNATLDNIYKYIDENATEEEFLALNSDLNRLELIVAEDNKDVNKLFTTTMTPIWLTIFHKFTTYGLDDINFLNFLNAYTNGLKDKEINGVSMESFGNKHTKDKTVLTNKINLLIALMEEFLHIERNENESKNEVINNDGCIECSENKMTALEFIKENVDSNATEDDLACYEDVLNDLTVEVNNDSKLLEAENNNSMLALVAYSFVNDIDLEKWFVNFFERNNEYISDQKENYFYMINDLNDYIHKDVVA